jgi:hypothetical protein
MDTRVRHLLLDLDLGSEPVKGSVGAEGDEPLGFTGYAGLIAALQTIRADEPVAVAEPEEDPS